MLWLVCLFVSAAHFVLVFWKATLEREIRWELYAVRDGLRWAAIERPELLDHPDFWALDNALTRWCRHLHAISLWPMLVLARKVGSSRGVFVAEVSPVRPFYNQASELLTKHIRQRHLLVGRLGLRLLSRYASDLETTAEMLVQRAPAGPASRPSTLELLRARAQQRSQSQAPAMS